MPLLFSQAVHYLLVAVDAVAVVDSWVGFRSHKPMYMVHSNDDDTPNKTQQNTFFSNRHKRKWHTKYGGIHPSIISLFFTTTISKLYAIFAQELHLH